MKKRSFLNIALCGAVCGTGMILPGVSGGTLAVLLNIYDDLIFAVNNLTKQFKQSFMFLLPFGLGLAGAFGAMFFPLKLAIEHFPLPTVMLFVGLMLGSIPSLVQDSLKNGIKPIDALSIALPLALVVGICFIPGISSVNLGADMQTITYFLLFVMGVLSSIALVVPGISGSMLLMILGFYQPLLNTISAIFSTPLHSIIVLGIFTVGIVVGFFTIAKIMGVLLNKFPRPTYWAIFGFVIGSLPAIFFALDYATIPLDAWHFIVGGILLVAGTFATYFFTRYAEKKNNK